MSKPVVGLFTTTEGHQSIAETVQQVLEDEFRVETYLERDETFDFYVHFYRFFPSLLRVPFKVVRQKRIAQLLTQYFHKKYQAKIRHFYSKYHPDILINTYFMYNLCLADLAEQHHISFINVLTDPRTIHPLLVAEKAECNLTFDASSYQTCQNFFPAAHLQKMGWFVRKEYEQSYDQKEVRTRLQLKPDVLTLLISSGSEGTNIVTAILPALINTHCPLQILVACGSNKSLFRSIQAVSEHLLGNNTQFTIRPIAFTKELYLYMQAADLVIGKAGPNSIFESVATLTPFFAITHIAGQEDGNLDIIRDYQLGYVEENMFKASRLLRKIIRNPEQLTEFQPYLKKIAAYNASSKKEFKELVHRLMKIH